MMDEAYIPLSKPTIGQEEIDEVIDTLRAGWVTEGPKVRRFEEAFRDYVGVAYAVAASSGTAALHVALAAASIGPAMKSSPRRSPSVPP